MHYACVLNAKYFIMAILQIRNLSEEIYLKIKESATLNHRSLAQEAASLLEYAIDNKSDNNYKRKRSTMIKKIRNIKKTAITIEALSQSICEDRDR